MRCLRCGRETEESASFCADCLALMEQHPVKPGTPVILPPARKPLAKAAATKSRNPEEVIASLQKRIRRLYGLVLVLLVFLVGMAAILYFDIDDRFSKDPIGQNYSTSESTAPLPGSVSG